MGTVCHWQTFWSKKRFHFIGQWWYFNPQWTPPQVIFKARSVRTVLVGWEKCSYQVCTYTGCPRRNVPDFRRMFLMLRYTDITQNTYIQSWTVMEIWPEKSGGLLRFQTLQPAKLMRRATALMTLRVECSVNPACVTAGCLYGSWKPHVKCLEP